MTTKPKLRYFNFKAVAEPIRYVLAYAGIDFEDERIALSDWMKVKPTTPFGSLPVLELDGKEICQSTAILRYFAKKCGLAGKDPFEDLLIDAMADAVVDLRLAFGQYEWRTPEAEKPARAEALKKETVPTFMKQFEKTIKENNGYLVNGKLTYADILLATAVQYCNVVIEYDIAEGYPSVQALIPKVEEIPRIQEWIKKRPDNCEFPF